MASENTAGSGSRVAGMVYSLWLLVLGPSVLALEEVLLDTTGETSEIGWLTYPPGGVSATLHSELILWPTLYSRKGN